jgi:hypothetical protein
MNQRTYALGRLRTGQMNKTEAAYAQQLEDRKRVGDVAWWKFEGIKFRLADSTFYSPDFAVMLADGTLECHEVKGRTTKTNSKGEKYAAPYALDDAKQKIKIAADMFPIRFIIAFPLKGGWWDVRPI